MKPHVGNFSALPNEHLGAVLTYHLNMEGLLIEILKKRLPNPDVLDFNRIMFSQELVLCRALGAITDKHFELLKKMNTLRNKFAHQLGHTTNFDEILSLVHQAGDAGIDFSDEVNALSATEAQAMGYDVWTLLNTLFENTFYWLASNQDGDTWQELTS